ncbi:type II toxin-antitoxin system VapC family toxin [Desulfobacterota bacterium AH_259_B03_O07]|nr:type II toxin-antitoxin system VapC family toxin [Desulfobacterota bacterium AH_259_B03_O07]
MVVIDTDILIWILRGEEKVKSRFTETVVETKGYVFITPVQVAEIFAGLKENERIKTHAFLESLNMIDIDKQIGEIAGEYIRKYKKSYSMTLADALVGASAKINGFKLWTLNTKHYPMFEANEFAR